MYDLSKIHYHITIVWIKHTVRITGLLVVSFFLPLGILILLVAEIIALLDERNFEL